MRFFKKIQDWILKSERIRKRILCFFITQINPRSLESWCIKGTEGYPFPEWILRFLWCTMIREKETQNPFSDSFGFKNPILDFFLKKRTLRITNWWQHLRLCFSHHIYCWCIQPKKRSRYCCWQHLRYQDVKWLHLTCLVWPWKLFFWVSVVCFICQICIFPP